jgi:uncharacterized membrane protein SirB2
VFFFITVVLFVLQSLRRWENARWPEARPTHLHPQVLWLFVFVLVAGFFFIAFVLFVLQSLRRWENARWPEARPTQLHAQVLWLFVFCFGCWVFFYYICFVC